VGAGAGAGAVRARTRATDPRGATLPWASAGPGPSSPCPEFAACVRARMGRGRNGQRSLSCVRGRPAKVQRSHGSQSQARVATPVRAAVARPSVLAPDVTPAPVTAASLAAAPIERQKPMLGAALFAHVRRWFVDDVAHRVVDNLLALDNNLLLELAAGGEALRHRCMAVAGALAGRAASSRAEPAHLPLSSPPTVITPPRAAPPGAPTPPPWQIPVPSLGLPPPPPDAPAPPLVADAQPPLPPGLDPPSAPPPVPPTLAPGPPPPVPSPMPSQRPASLPPGPVCQASLVPVPWRPLAFAHVRSASATAASPARPSADVLPPPPASERAPYGPAV